MQRAAAVGVRADDRHRFQRRGTRKAIELARAHPGRLFATAGVHPHHAADLTAEALARLRRLARRPRWSQSVNAASTIFATSPRAICSAAPSAGNSSSPPPRGKPVFLHQRDAHDDFLAILREHRGATRRRRGALLHGRRKERDAYLELGLHIGITGWICDERRGLHLREVVKGIPADRLMLETDAPYLLPRDLKPAPKTRRNEPHHLPHVAHAVAAARGQALETLAREATDTTRRFFGDLPARCRRRSTQSTMRRR